MFSLTAGPDATERRYYQLHYDYEVAAHCGLVSPRIEQAFRAKRRVADGIATRPVEVQRQIRLKAYVDAAGEYDNRSLGGHKQWCRLEGREGVRRLLTLPE